MKIAKPEKAETFLWLFFVNIEIFKASNNKNRLIASQVWYFFDKKMPIKSGTFDLDAWTGQQP